MTKQKEKKRKQNRKRAIADLLLDQCSKVQSKKKGNNQKLIQPNLTSHPKNQKGKKDTHKLTKAHERHSKPNEQLLPKQMVIQPPLFETAVTCSFTYSRFKLQNRTK